MEDMDKHTKYETRIRRKNKGSNEIMIPKDIGNPGDFVEVYVKVTKKLVNVES